MLRNVNFKEHGIHKLSVDGDNWDRAKLAKGLSVHITKMNESEMEFDLIGLEVAFANALRRVLLAEVPSMAIDRVEILNNTSIMQDEVLVHRLGLIPLKADPRNFHWNRGKFLSEKNSLEFHLNVKYTSEEGPKGKLSSVDCPRKSVLSGDLVWKPVGNQAAFHEPSSVGPVHEDILITKLVRGQEIEAKMWALKGVPKVNAKFQSVCTAFYRMMPEIKLLEDVYDERAIRLQKCFTPGVIELDTAEDGRVKARVENARSDKCSMNALAQDDLKKAVSVARVPNHFIFSIESVGALHPNALFLEAVKVLQDKCERWVAKLQAKEI